MRKTSIIFLFNFIVSLIFATSYDIDFGTNKNKINVEENNNRKLTMNFVFAGIRNFEVQTKKGIFDEITIPNTYDIGKIGTPKLPAAKKLIEIPFDAEISVSITHYSIAEYKLSDFGISKPLMPVQPPLSKSVTDPSQIQFIYQ